MYNEVLEKTLITEEQIQKRVTELAKQIENDYAGKAPIIIPTKVPINIDNIGKG